MPGAPSDVRSLARQWTGPAIQKLAKLAQFAESESVQAQACIAILDRGWGKPASTFDSEEGGDIRIVVRHIICGERAAQPQPKLLEHGDGRELVGDKGE